MGIKIIRNSMTVDSITLNCISSIINFSLNLISSITDRGGIKGGGGNRSRNFGAWAQIEF